MKFKGNMGPIFLYIPTVPVNFLYHNQFQKNYKNTNQNQNLVENKNTK